MIEPNEFQDSFSSDESESLVNNYYEKHYENVHGSGVMGRAALLQQRELEKHRKGQVFPVTLELGSGNFQHYPHVLHERSRYIASDIRVPNGSQLYQDIKAGRGPEELEFLESDACNIPLLTGSVDRVVATCLLLHLDDPVKAIIEWQRVCKSSGVIDFLIPCEPGLALRFFRVLVSERTAMRNGVSREQFRVVNALDHKSSLPRALALAKLALSPGRKMKVRYYPFRFLRSWNMNFFVVVSLEPR